MWTHDLREALRLFKREPGPCRDGSPCVRRGRLFDARDSKALAAVIVSEAVATRFFAGEDPVGHRVSLGDTTARSSASSATSAGRR